MKQSQLFTKTRKEAPADEVAKNAQLLIRAGYIHKEMAGVYSYLPLGLRVVERIKQVVREEMNKLDGQEIIMTALQRKELWERTDRWNDEKVDVWFKSTLKSGGDVGFGWSHEEPITDMMRNYIASYRDLPTYVYQFQTKLRNELRAKSGIMRGREFVMKDMYSYTTDENAHIQFYEQVSNAYFRVFDRTGLGSRTFRTYASGGAFTEFSHEFQTLSDAGEDTIYLWRAKNFAFNKEILTEEMLNKVGATRSDLEEVKSIEVGNTFSFGGTKSQQLGLLFKDEDGTLKPAILGSYGLGITRLMGAIVEVLADDKGLVWPESVAPFRVHLVELSQGNAEIKKMADDLYTDLHGAGVEVLYDDRDARAGEKFADSDLMGIPYRVVVGKNTTIDSVEVVRRSDGNVTQYSRGAILKGTYAHTS